MLDLHKVHLTEKAISSLKKQFGKHANPPVIDYKAALNQINLDLNAAGDETNAEMKWTTQKEQPITANDSAS